MEERKLQVRGAFRLRRITGERHQTFLQDCEYQTFLRGRAVAAAIDACRNGCGFMMLLLLVMLLSASKKMTSIDM